MRSILAMISALLVFVGCGSDDTPVQRAKTSAERVKKATGGAVGTKVEEVAKMANGTQDI